VTLRLRIPPWRRHGWTPRIAPAITLRRSKLRSHHCRKDQGQSAAWPSKVGLEVGVTAALRSITKSVPVETPSAAFVVVVLGIESDIVTFDPRLQHHEPAHLSPNLNVLSKQGVGLMLWPRLHSVHLTFSWQLRIAPSFSVMQEDLCVDVSAMPLLGWLPQTFSLCLPR